MKIGNSKSENGNPKNDNETSKIGEPEPFSNFEFQISNPPASDRSSLKYFIIAAAAIVVVLALAIVISRNRSASPRAEAVLTVEQEAYLSNIGFAEARVSAATNFLGQRVIYLDAQISNRGTRELVQVEANLEFTDVLGQVILRERAKIFPQVSLPLKPGESREFQLFFDHLPSEWNQGPPRITAASVQFQ